MATQADSSSLSPEVVGNAFVEQYYCILHQSPDMVHKFYQESSKLSRPDPSGTMTLVTTIKGINDKILSMDYQNFKVQIFSADAQASYNNGLIVLVTGRLIGKDDVRRKFTQSFFLAPQDKGYFVLNDIFRYVDEMEEKGKEQSTGVAINDADKNIPTAPLTADFEPVHVPNHPVPNHTTPVNEDTENSKEASHPLENGKVLVAEKSIVAEHPVVSSKNDVCLVSETAASKTQEEAPKKSFASVVHDLNNSNAPFVVVVRVPPVKPVEQSQGTAAPVASTPSSNNTVERNNTSVKGHSIFVGNLPDNATVAQLKVIFEQFGPIKTDGIQVRSQKQTGNCFGFVEFESATSVQSVLKASPISIGNRRASIEVKRGNSEGGKFPSSHGGYHDNNFRGRGNFNEGRGYRRNDYDKRGEFSGRARSTSGSNGEANHKGHQIEGKVVHQGHSLGGIK